MHKISLSIENCLRWLEKEIVKTSFLTFQIPIPENSLSADFLKAKVYALDAIWEQTLQVNSDKVIFIDSHEDPILKRDGFIFLNLHLEVSLFYNKPKEIILEITQNSLLIHRESLFNLPYDRLFNQLYSKIEGFNILSKKDCNLTLHLGDSQAMYHEEQFELKNNVPFNFQSYIKDYSYVGVQCSYDQDSPEIEEKHILKGQKGVYETAIYKKTYYSCLPCSEKFLNHYGANNTQFKEINSIDELITYYHSNQPHSFYMDYHFLINHYQSHLTYSQNNIFSSKPLKGKIHLDNMVCQQCSKKSACMQAVPSGLSYDLFKLNIALNDPEECSIYNLLNNIV